MVTKMMDNIFSACIELYFWLILSIAQLVITSIANTGKSHNTKLSTLKKGDSDKLKILAPK